MQQFTPRSRNSCDTEGTEWRDGVRTRGTPANKAIDLIRRRRDAPTAELPEALIEERGFLRHEQDDSFFALVRSLPEGQRSTLVVRSQAMLGLEKLRQVDPVTENQR